MRKELFILIGLISISCSDHKESKKDLINDDTLEYIRLEQADTLKERQYIAVFDKRTKRTATLSDSEIKIINKNLITAVDNYNSKLKLKVSELEYNERKLDLRNYYRQYIISFDSDGNKIIRVLCLCSHVGDNWKKEIMNVHDGGDCFLDAIINITKNSIEYFGTHGFA